MSKTVFAVVADEAGVTAEIRGTTTAEVRALLPKVSDLLDTLDAQAPPAESVQHRVAAAALDQAGVGANGQVLAALSAFLQQLAPLLLQILPLFIKPGTQTSPSTN